MIATDRAETRLKAAVIDRLLEGGHVDLDSVIISEMTIANWTRRADIVLANGKLWAFELKSESDSLSRLPGQLEVFSYHFEKLVVVVAARFEEQARMMLPEGVGLWVEEQIGSLKERIRPKILPLSKDAAIALMTVAELRRLLSCNGNKGAKDASRQELEKIALGFPTSDIANAARDAVKRRFRASHVAFLKRRASVGSVAAMPSLRRFAPRPSGNLNIESHTVLPEVSLPLDHPMLHRAPAGLVLKRRLR